MVVLSNLIDNAIEACEKNQAPEHKTILLRMNADPVANFLYIENYSEEPVKIVDNRILSTKPDRFSPWLRHQKHRRDHGGSTARNMSGIMMKIAWSSRFPHRLFPQMPNKPEEIRPK